MLLGVGLKRKTRVRFAHSRTGNPKKAGYHSHRFRGFGQNGRLPAIRLCGPVDMSTFLNVDCAHPGETAKLSAERAATRATFPPNAGFEGPRVHPRKMLFRPSPKRTRRATGTLRINASRVPWGGARQKPLASIVRAM
jgi:hypothetical protein